MRPTLLEKSKMSSILIVEDDIALRQKIRDVLWSAFPTISVLKASNSAEGFKKSPATK